jgi:hypothetical protein
VKRIDVRREKVTGLTWPQLRLLSLLSGAIGGVVVFWWQLDRDWFPVVALVIAAIVLSASVALVRLAETIWGRYDDEPKGRQ